jgi:acyl-CoA synthetase (NDP forming)
MNTLPMNIHPLHGPALAEALFKPRTIAIVGISDDTGKTSGRPLHFLRRAGYSGTVYPVNPRRATVQGEKAYASLEDLPDVPDHVFVLTPTETVLETVATCGRLGVKVVTVLASGFSEAGPEGAKLEAKVRAEALRGGVRLLGPSSLGVVNPSTGMMLTANAAFAEPDLPKGNVFVASHSGSMIGALVSRGKVRGVGFAGLVSVGVEADLSIGEICEATLDDPTIGGYLLFLESLRHGPQLRAFALAAARKGKPVIAYKLGQSTAAAEMATTHTGALAGEDDVAGAFLKDMGIARVGVIEALLECFPLARRIELADRPAPRVGIVTTTGGGAAMVVDQLGIRGIDAQPPSPAVLEKLRAAGIQAQPGRVLDLTLAGTRYEIMKGALDVLLDCGEFDLVLAVVGSSARFQPHLAVRPIVESAGHKGALAAMLVPEAPEALASLTEAGVPCFRSPEACADAIAAVFGRRVPGRQPSPSATESSQPGPLSESQAYGVLEQLGIAYAPFVTMPLAGPVAHMPFEFPVVAKLCSDQIPHKTEIGGVVLSINDLAALDTAVSTLRGNLAERAPGVVCHEVLVQSMTRGLAEVLIGYRVDPDAGPIIMLAAGGIWAEVARDRSIRLAPVTVQSAREMILEVKALKAVTGLRGKERGDLEALANAVSALSQLAIRAELQILEAEVNPLMVMREGQGVLAVDALMLRS